MAELAQSFTYRVVCRGRSQQAGASSSKNQGRLAPCPGSYETVTWTNCVGEVTYPNGDQYVGTWRDGKVNGHGTFASSNGEKYVGAWRDGKLNGHGTYMYSNGDQHVGEWRDGKENGRVLVYLANGSILSTIWETGIIIRIE